MIIRDDQWKPYVWENELQPLDIPDFYFGKS